jgi:DNA-binding CsgD family transcriptional regulator
LDRQLAERAIGLEEEQQAPWVQRGAVMNFAVGLKQTDRLDEAREWFGRALVQARERGDESTLPDLLAHLADLECWAGNWSLADRYASESAEAFELMGQRGWMGIPSYARALVDAHLGRIDSARGAAEQGLAATTTVGDTWAEMMLCAAAGFAELSAHNLKEADTYLGRAHVLADRIGLVEPSVWRFHANEIEVAIAMGDLERATRLLARFRRRHGGPRTAWTAATGARCQGLLKMAQGDGAAAQAALDRALVLHEDLPMPFEHARTLLVAGQVQRRLKRKRAAKEHLQRAVQILSSLPAPLWEQQARDDLARVGLRPPSPEDLSATEEAVAGLAATGRTNRQIAEELFISPKTVEANLARAYRKLEITSRVQLGAALAGRGAEANRR